MQIVDLRGSLLSGTVRGNADISLARNDPHYRANVSVSAIDFPHLTDLYYNYQTAHGQLSGTYDFTGLGSDARTMRGRGKVEVTNGNVFAIPIFGPLSGILNHIVPGSGYSIAHKASTSFSISEGIIHIDDFDAAGTFFSMLGHGDIHFLDDKLDFNLRLNMKGPEPAISRMILKNTRCASQISKAFCIQRTRSFGSTRRFGKPLCLTNFATRPP